MPQTEELVLDDITVRLTHSEKVLFPEDGITKGDLARYYAQVVPAMLPHVRGRPLTMHRFPRGIDHEGFYHKEAPGYFPEWIERIEILLRNGEIQRQVVCEHGADLVYLANQNCVTPHVWLSRRDQLNFPDRLILDLDPPDSSPRHLTKTARETRRILESLEMPSYPLSTGSRGIHIIVPIDRTADFDRVRAFAVEIAGLVAENDPEHVTTEQRIENRGERLFVDTNRNAYGQTGVAPYSVRALPGAPVAVPLEWEELGGQTFNARNHTIHTVFQRLDQKGDLLEGMDRHAVSLSDAEDKLAGIKGSMG